MKTNNTHCVVIKPKENSVIVLLEGYVSKAKEVECKEINGNDGKTFTVANASINLVNQQSSIEFLCKTLDVDEECIYTSYGQEDKYHSIKVSGFNLMATRMEKLMKPGNRVVLVGSASKRQWEDNNGEIRDDVSLIINDFWVSNFVK